MADEPRKMEPNEERRVMERREFLRKCGKYAAVVPPAMVLLLSTTRGAQAVHGGPSPPGNPDPPVFPPGFSFAPPFGGTPPGGGGPGGPGGPGGFPF